MNLIFSTKVIFISLFLGVLSDQELNTIKNIDSTYSAAESESDLHKLKGLIHQAIKFFPKSGEIFWRLGRTYFKLGEKSTSESEKIRYFLLCVAETKNALKINKNLAHGYFFNGLCVGSLGQVQGIWSSLAKIKPFKKNMETAISIDPTVSDGGPHRALANLYLKLPYFLGGDLTRAIEHFLEAVRLGPKFGENYLGLAEAYIQKNNFDLAEDTLQALIEITVDSQKEELENKWYIEAISLLKKIKK